MMYGNGWMWGHGWGWSGWFVMGVMLLFVLAVVVGVVATIRYLSASNRPPTQPAAFSARPGPEMLLAERFARGDIDDDEYRRRLSLLHAYR